MEKVTLGWVRRRRENHTGAGEGGGRGGVSGEAISIEENPIWTSGHTPVGGLSHRRDLSFNRRSRDLGCLYRDRCNEMNFI